MGCSSTCWRLRELMFGFQSLDLMEEIIQECIEDRLPELEQLKRIGLFRHAEIKAIIKKASDLEYRIQKRALCKEDFINYVQYEINLLELIQRRRACIGYSFK